MVKGGEVSLAPWNFHWIVKDNLAIMGYPKSEANVRYIDEVGIRHLISLAPEKKPPMEFFPRHLRFTPLEVAEFEPPTPKQINIFINICRCSLQTHEPVGVHCRMGLGRSGVMAACYFVYFYEMNPDRAITHVRLISPGAIETYMQEKAVHQYYDFIRSMRPPSPNVEELALILVKEIRPYKTVLQKYSEL